MGNETVRGMTDGQRSDIIATMVGTMPSLSFDEAQGIIGSKGPFVADIGEVFKRHTGKPVPAAQPSTEFTIGGRVYELVVFLKEGEGLVIGEVMEERTLELNANLGKEDCQFIQDRQHEIPHEYQGKFYLVFASWRDPEDSPHVACLRWVNGRWFQYWSWQNQAWREDGRLVRRKK